MNKIRILFVCLGNICRSPTAHGIFLEKLHAAGLQDQVEVDSAGTGDWHIGKPPDKRSLAAALKRGYDLSPLRARRVEATDFHQFDYVLAMDSNNLFDLERLAPPGYGGTLGLFLQFARHPNAAALGNEVPDPYMGGSDGFEQVLDLVEDACDGLLDHVQQTLTRER